MGRRHCFFFFLVIKKSKTLLPPRGGKKRNETRVLLKLDGESREKELRKGAKKKKASGAVKYPPSRDTGQVRPRKLALRPFLSLITGEKTVASLAPPFTDPSLLFSERVELNRHRLVKNIQHNFHVNKTWRTAPLWGEEKKNHAQRIKFRR